MDMVMSTTIGKISTALLKAQKNMGAAVKDAKNPFFKSSYADLNSVREASHPALNAEGITVLQPIVQKDSPTGGLSSYVRTLLLHESGEYIGSDTQVVCSKPNDPQAQGSAISYARRYGLQALVSLGAEDDDGEKAMGRYNVKVTNNKTEIEKADTKLATPQTKASSFRKPAAKTVETVTVTTDNGTDEEGWT